MATLHRRDGDELARRRRRGARRLSCLRYELLVGLSFARRACTSDRPRWRPPTANAARAIVVLDGVGTGEAPDAADYGDAGSDTLGNTARAVGGFDLPALESLGLGTHQAHRRRERDERRPPARGACMVPQSAGKDSTTGHWEIAGLHLARPFPTYPDGFPRESDRRVRARDRPAGDRQRRRERHGGHRRVRAGAPANGRVDRLHVRRFGLPGRGARGRDSARRSCTRRVTSRASCWLSRTTCRASSRGRSRASRAGSRACPRIGAISRIEPPGETLLDALAAAGMARAGVGKVDDLFAGRAITATHTANNAAGHRGDRRHGCSRRLVGSCFANLVDFDQLFGHRNDVAGFYGALREFDRALPSILSALREDDLLFITADHGNDPTTPSTDHARECVPLLVAGRAGSGRSIWPAVDVLRSGRDGRRLVRPRVSRARDSRFSASLVAE